MIAVLRRNNAISGLSVVARGGLARRWPMVLGAAVAITALSASAYCAAHYRHLATFESAAAYRAEQANADLQYAIDRLRDEVAVMRVKVRAGEGNQQTAVVAERDAAVAEQNYLRARVNNLEQQLAALQSRQLLRRAGKATSATGAAAPGYAASGSALGSAPASDATGPATLKNFTPPGWVPNYFSSEGRDQH